MTKANLLMLALLLGATRIASASPLSQPQNLNGNETQHVMPSPTTKEKVTEVPSASSVPRLDNPESAALQYVFGHNQSNRLWHFIYGPLHSPNKSVQYSIQGKNGFLTFSCDSSGRQEMALAIAGEESPIGKNRDFDIGIGSINNTVSLLSSAKEPHQQESVYYGTGAIMMNILTGISSLDDTASSEAAIVFSIDGRFLELPNPKPVYEAAETVKLCKTWYQKHLESILKEKK